MMNHKTYTFQLTNARAYSPYQFPLPINVTMEKGEQWIVYGRNGIGKTMLANIARSCYRFKEGNVDYDFEDCETQRISENIHYISFHDQYGDSNEPTFYQLRWNQGLLNDDDPTLEQVLANLFLPQNQELLQLLDLEKFKDRQIIMLSSGEFRRFQIARILLKHPKLLIIDNPFIGLDQRNRNQVSIFFNKLIDTFRIQIILIASRKIPDESHFTHIITFKEGQATKQAINEAYWTETSLPTIEQLFEASLCIQNLPDKHEDENQDTILELNNVSIQYGGRKILNQINWKILKGEKWALEGENGSGKSTLLGLISADNPQAYACDITLFGRKRGTGESIWDIKKHLGYVCPEMYKNYRRDIPVKDIVASGLYDCSGLFRRYTDDDYKKIHFWLNLYNLQDVAEHSYLTLSDGMQRLVLLARAFVKDPDLLILDEPFHGLDEYNRKWAMNIIEAFCKRKNKTLIMVSHYKEDFPPCITKHFKLDKPQNT